MGTLYESSPNHLKYVGATVEHEVPLVQPKWDQPLGTPRRRTSHGLKPGDGPPHLLSKKKARLYLDPRKGVGVLRVKPFPAAPDG